MGLFDKKKKRQHSSFTPTENSKTLHRNLEFTATEQYKLLRTNLSFTLPEGEKCPVIGVSSSMRGEGKSTTSVNLSYVLAEKGKKVLLIDGDLRIPSIAKKMEIDSSPGVTDMLMNRGVDIEHFKTNILDNWYILPSGDIPPNPSELLGSHRMEVLLKEMREIFDYIVIDLPPVNIVSDALSISGLISGIIIVIREGHTEKKELERCIRFLKLSNVNVLGCVMNGATSGGGAYGKYRRNKYYRSSRYYYKRHGYDAYETPKEEGEAESSPKKEDGQS